jgi:hypothetical protein
MTLFRMPLAALALAGCTTSSTPSADLQAYFTATLYPATFDAPATLGLELQIWDYSNTGVPYVLSAGESAHAQFRGADIELVQGYFENEYGAAFRPDLPVVADERIALTIERDDGDAVLEVTAPPDFVLEAPATSPQPVSVTWSPIAADPMHWRVAEPCGWQGVDGSDGPIPEDSGRVDFPAGVLADARPASSCRVDVTIGRSRLNIANTPLGAASAWFDRLHTIAVEVTP